MAVISKGQTFATGDQVSALKLNNLADNATFASGAVDNVSTQLSGGAIVVKDGGVTTAKLNDGAVTTAKITDANVTTAKIADANVTFAKLTDVIDDDTMATASATTLATSESIKAYVDAIDLTEYSLKHSGSTGTISVTNSFADWDLSSVVGSNRAMVIMELWDTSVGCDLMVRTKGSSVQPNQNYSFPGWGASGLFVNTANQGGTLVVITNESGIIEIRGSGSASGINYKIQAYQKLA